MSGGPGSNGDAPALALAHVSLRYPGQVPGRAALSDVSVRLARGERLLVLGANGSGKSTLLRIASGLLTPTAGEARLWDVPPRRVRHAIGVVFHAPSLYEDLTAGENLRLFASLYGAQDPRERAACVLQDMDCAHLADVRIRRLSRGQQQRVAIARALIDDPSLLLLDEPETGLDAAAFGLLRGQLTQDHRTVLLATHSVERALPLATEVLILAEGRVAHHWTELGALGPGTILEAMAELVRHEPVR